LHEYRFSKGRQRNEKALGVCISQWVSRNERGCVGRRDGSDSETMVAVLDCYFLSRPSIAQKSEHIDITRDRSQANAKEFGNQITWMSARNLSKVQFMMTRRVSDALGH